MFGTSSADNYSIGIISAKRKHCFCCELIAIVIRDQRIAIKMHFRRSIPLLVTLLALAVLESSDATTGGEHQKSLPSIEQIRRFFATIDQSVIDRIRSTVKIATLVSKLRKIFQFKQQLREGLNKRTELNGNGLKSIDKSLKMLLSPTMWTSKLRFEDSARLVSHELLLRHRISTGLMTRFSASLP